MQNKSFYYHILSVASFLKTVVYSQEWPYICKKIQCG